MRKNLDNYEKEENKENNNNIKEEEKIQVINSRTILVNDNKDKESAKYNNGIFSLKYIDYIDIIESLIYLYNEKVYFSEYPSFKRIVEYENNINIMDIYYCNYQKNSNKLYVNYNGKGFTNIYLIKNKSIKLLEEKIPLDIDDLIEISSIKIIVLDKTNNFCSCFELKNKIYQEIKKFTKGENIYSVKRSPNGNKFFIMNTNCIQVYDSKTLELINVINIKNNDICFINNNNFIIFATDFLILFNLKTFKKLDEYYYSHIFMGRLHKIGNKGYFIAAELINVSRVKILELHNNKINYIRELDKNTIPFCTSLYFNNTLFIGGFNKIFMFTLDIK